MNHSDWPRNAFTLSLIGYASTCENNCTPFFELRMTGCNIKLFFNVKIKRTDFDKQALRNRILVIRVIKERNVSLARTHPLKSPTFHHKCLNRPDSKSLEITYSVLSTLPDNPGDTRFWTVSPSLQIRVWNRLDNRRILPFLAESTFLQ